MYYVCVGTALLIGLAVTGPALHVRMAVLARSLASWLFFSIGGRASVNGADTSRIVAGVTWTLALEWGFYLLLPFLGWFARRAPRLIWMVLLFGAVFVGGKYAAGSLVHFPAAAAVLAWVRGISKFILIGFGGGILVATFDAQLKKINRLTARQASALLLGLYLTYLFVPGIEAVGQVLLLCGFALVVQGVDLFGLITSRGVRLLGIVSYDIYVAHGTVYYLATRVRGGIHPVPVAAYLPETLLCIAIILLVSTIMHFAVERPTMFLSERIARGKGSRAAIPQTIAA